MAGSQWVKVRSWHAVEPTADPDGRIKTRCGRWVTGEVVDDLPAEKSCESCLRIVARLQDR